MGEQRVSVEADFTGVVRPMFHLTYQQYLLRAFEAAGASLRVTPRRTRFARLLLDRGARGGMRLHRDRPAEDPNDPGPPVRYTIRDAGGRTTRMVIDAFDARALRFPDAVQACDVYYKLNYWPSQGHPPKVRPLMNVNARLSGRHLARLRALRQAQKSTDLVFWSRIWEPREDGPYDREQRRNLLEHQVRTFEALAQAPGRTDLRAIVPRRSSIFDITAMTRRLGAAGVRVQNDWGSIGTDALWQALASARVVALRPGFHLCVSWRMTDLLAMGACIFCEDAPYPVWHRPLVAGTHFAHGGCGLTPDLALPPDGDYRTLTDRLTGLLADRPRQQRLGRNAAAYFDAHCTPARLGEHLLGVENSAQLRSERLSLGLLSRA